MPADKNDPNRELYSIAVITVDESAFPEMRRALSGSFKTTLAGTEEQIKAVVEDPQLHGILFDLDSIGEGARDGLMS
jgi:ClpP class serine protease